RRTHYLRTPVSPADVVGPFLTRDGGLVKRLTGADDGGASAGRPGAVVADQLAADVWLLLPNDRTRLIFWTAREPGSGEPLLNVYSLLCRSSCTVDGNVTKHIGTPPIRTGVPKSSDTLAAHHVRVVGGTRAVLVGSGAAPTLPEPARHRRRGSDPDSKRYRHR